MPFFIILRSVIPIAQIGGVSPTCAVVFQLRSVLMSPMTPIVLVSLMTLIVLVSPMTPIVDGAVPAVVPVDGAVTAMVPVDGVVPAVVAPVQCRLFKLSIFMTFNSVKGSRPRLWRWTLSEKVTSYFHMVKRYTLFGIAVSMSPMTLGARAQDSRCDVCGYGEAEHLCEDCWEETACELCSESGCDDGQPQPSLCVIRQLLYDVATYFGVHLMWVIPDSWIDLQLICMYFRMFMIYTSETSAVVNDLCNNPFSRFETATVDGGCCRLWCGIHIQRGTCILNLSKVSELIHKTMSTSLGNGQQSGNGGYMKT